MTSQMQEICSLAVIAMLACASQFQPRPPAVRAIVRINDPFISSRLSLARENAYHGGLDFGEFRRRPYR